jgi:O-antigen ligase
MQITFKQIPKYLLYTLVFLLPWQTIFIVREVFYGGEKWQYGTIGIYLVDIIIILWILLTLFIYHKNIKHYVLEKKYLTISMLSIVLWSFLSSLWASDTVLSIYFSILLFFGFIIFVFVQTTKFSLRTIANIFIISTALQSIIGTIQFLTQKTFSQKILGLQYHNIWSGGNAVITNTTGRWLRDYGAMPHPNIFGILLVCAILLSIGLYVSTDNKKYLIKFLYLISIGLFTTNLLFTFSRTSWILLIIGIMPIMFITYRSSLCHIKNILAPLLLIIGIVSAIIIVLPNLFFTRITQDSLPTHNSIEDRTLYINQSLTEIKNHPLIGTGIGNYTNTVAQTNQHDQPIWFYQPVHNVYILIMTELGVIGLILFAIFFFFFFKEIIVNKKEYVFLQKIFLIITMLFFLLSFTDHMLWTSHFGILLFFLFAGLSQTKILPTK